MQVLGWFNEWDKQFDNVRDVIVDAWSVELVHSGFSGVAQTRVVMNLLFSCMYVYVYVQSVYPGLNFSCYCM